MAFFKFRKTGDEPNSATAMGGPGAPAESVEAMRKRATFRLIGAAVLVLAGVIGFPMLFDSQPRPVPVDIAIEIPDKNNVTPLAVPAPAPATMAPAATGVVTDPPTAPAAGIGGQKTPPALVEPAQTATKNVATETPKEAPREAPKPEPKQAPKPETKPEPKSEPKAPAKSAANADDGAKALALLEGKAAAKPADAPAEAAAAGSRYVVQVGAFADAARAREARGKLEAAGLKTYTQVVDTKDGKRTRVRVGPFADKAGAESAAAKVKALDLSASVLTL